MSKIGFCKDCPRYEKYRKMAALLRYYQQASNQVKRKRIESQGRLCDVKKCKARSVEVIRVNDKPFHICHKHLNFLQLNEELFMSMVNDPK